MSVFLPILKQKISANQIQTDHRPHCLYFVYLFINQIAANEADIEPTFIRATIHEPSPLVMGEMGESSRRNFGIAGEFHPKATADDNKISVARKHRME